MSRDLTDDKSTMVQVMAWCRQATSHYLSRCWPRSLSPYGVTRPQWVKSMGAQSSDKLQLFDLTHWGQVTYICIMKLTIIGWDNGLPPGWCQAINWINAGILLIRTLGTNFSEILCEIPTFSFKKMHLKMPSVKWRPFCVDLNVLKIWHADNSPSNGCQAAMTYYPFHNGTTLYTIWCPQRLCWTVCICSVRDRTVSFPLTHF